MNRKMRKYLYNIFIVFASIGIFTSCIYEYYDIEEVPEYNSGAGDRVSLNFKVPFGKVRLRTGAGLDNVSIGEVMIKGIRIVLYDKNVPSVRHYWDYDINFQYDTASSSFIAWGNDVKSFDLNSSDESYSILAKARKIPQDDYRMLIIVNPTDEIKAITREGNTLDDLDAPFNTMAAHSMYQSWAGMDGTDEVPAYFLMLNSQGPINIVKGNFWPTAEEAENHPVRGSVERTVAKIVCSHIGSGSGNVRSVLEAGDGRFVMHLGYDISGDYDLPDWITHCIYDSGPWACGGTYDRTTKICNKCGIKYGFGLGNYTDIPRYVIATDLMWQVDVVNKKSYWYRHLTNKAGNTAMEQYGDTDTRNFYAEDPNFSGFSGKAEAELSKEFLYKTDVQYTNGKGDSFRRLTPVVYKYSPYWSWQEGDNDPVYVPENTMAQDEQRGNLVTRVIVKAKLRRERFDTPANTFPIGDFFLFTGGVGGNSKYNMNNRDADGNYFYLLPAENVTEYKSGTTTTPVNLRNGDVSLADAIAKFTEDNPLFDWNNIGANENPAISDHLVFYKDGEMYYEVPIIHFPTKGEYGHFGVVRNRGYQLQIIDILSLGFPTIPIPGTDLIEQGSTRLSPHVERGMNSISFSWDNPMMF